MSSKYYKYGIACILILALFVRILYISQATFPPVKYDQHNYIIMSIQLIEHGIYAYNTTQSNANVTPGFPIFLTLLLKLFGYSNLEHTLMIIRYLQCFISLGYIGFIYLIGCRLFNPATALLASLFAAIYGPYAFMDTLILTETIFLVSFMALVYYQVRIIQENARRDHLIAGALLAITVLIRPNVLPLAIIPYVFLWFQHHKIYKREILYGLAMFALFMLPWWIRNWLTFHEFILVSKNGSGNPFLGGTNPYFSGVMPMPKFPLPKDQQFGEGLRRIKLGLHEDPILWIRWFTLGKTSFLLKMPYWGPYPHSIASWYESLLMMLHKTLYYFGSTALFIGSLFNVSIRFLTMSFAMLLAIQLMFIPENRYAIGMMPFLMLVTAYAFTLTIQTVIQKTQKTRLRQESLS